MAISIKRMLRESLAWGYHQANLALSRLRGKVIILTYHRVLSGKELATQFVQPGMYVRDEVFEMQARFLMQDFDVLRFVDLIDMWIDGRWDKKARYCVITFDDGWIDNYAYAFPILKHYGVPATVFLPTAFVGTDEWFWPDKLGYLLTHGAEQDVAAVWEYLRSRFPILSVSLPHRLGDIDVVIEALKKVPNQDLLEAIAELEVLSGKPLAGKRMIMNWSEVEEMSNSGISFGSHSVNHKILPCIPHDEMRYEIEASFRDLRVSKCNAVPVFCYPNSSCTDAIAEEVKNAGYRAAVGGNSGHERQVPSNLFQLKRIGIHNDIARTIPLFAWRLAGARTWV